VRGASEEYICVEEPRGDARCEAEREDGCRTRDVKERGRVIQNREAMGEKGGSLGGVERRARAELKELGVASPH